MGRLVDDHPELITEWNYEKNAGLNLEDITSGNPKKVWWRCDKGHEWEATIANRSNGSKCPICLGRQVMPGFNDLATTHPELATEWHPKKNGDLTPDQVTAGSGKKIWWQCPHGHEWEATIINRSKGQCCPICGGKKVLAGFNDLATINPELTAEWHPTKNGSLIPQDVTANSNKKVWWICKKGHEWEATINHRSSGTGCPICAGKQVLVGFNDLASVNPALAAEWHPTKNGSLTPQDVTVSSNKKVWWQCDFGHEWEAKIANRNIGRGCPICTSEMHTSFPEQAILYYLSLVTPVESRLQFDNIYEVDIFLPKIQTAIEYDGCYWHAGFTSQEKEKRKNEYLKQAGIQLIRIKEIPDGESIPIDSENTIYYQYTPDYNYLKDAINKLLQRLCLPDCDIDIERDRTIIWDQYIKSAKENSLAGSMPELAVEWHPTKNGDLTPEKVTCNSHKKVWWQCPKGHEWEATIAHRSNGRGCPICSGQQVLSGFNDLTTVNPILAAEWHPIKNGNLKPQDVTISSGKKVWWQCEKGHEWQATVEHRGHGQGCPVCAGRQVLPGFNDLATVNPELAAQWHPTKNGDLIPQGVTVSSGRKVWWQCNKGHEWQATIASRNSGIGCPICSGRQVLAGFNDLATVNPELAAEWHPTKNGDLTPQDVTAGNGKKVWWICPRCGNAWEARIYSRNNGCGCPICQKHRK